MLSTWSGILLIVPLAISAWADSRPDVQLSELTIGLLVAYFAAISGTSIAPWARQLVLALGRAQRELDKQVITGAQSGRDDL